VNYSLLEFNALRRKSKTGKKKTGAWSEEANSLKMKGITENRNIRFIKDVRERAARGRSLPVRRTCVPTGHRVAISSFYSGERVTIEPGGRLRNSFKKKQTI